MTPTTHIHFVEKQTQEYDGTPTTSIDMLLGTDQLGWTECRFYNDRFGDWQSRWHIGHTEIRSNYRRQGYGEQLLKEVCQRLWAKHRVPVTVDPVPQDPSISKEALEKFYTKCGFEKTGPGTRMRCFPT